jgi:CheY-like chemotaxis protein
MLTILLTRHGCHVIAAENGPQAIDLADKFHPDLILMDLRLPQLDGIAVTRSVRSHPVLNEVPIVIVTGFDGPEVHRDALSAGCNCCLAKPIDVDRLREVVTTLLHSAPQPPPVPYRCDPPTTTRRGRFASVTFFHR